MTIQQALELAALANNGDALRRAGELNKAVDVYRRALAIDAGCPLLYCKLGGTLMAISRFAEAIDAFESALRLQPADADAWNDLGNAYAQFGRAEQALGAYGRAIALRPGFAGALNNVGILLTGQGRLDDAVDAFKQSLLGAPNFAPAHVNLANALSGRGELDAAISHYRRAAEMTPDPAAASNLAYVIHFHPDYDSHSILKEQLAWNARFAAVYGRHPIPHQNDRNPARRLRVGYVSADFREHPVGRFLLPLFANHDRAAFEVFGYSGVRRSDEDTGRFCRLSHTWRDIAGLDDQALANLIRDDRIDILVDLTMHMEGSRLLTFARKPAPVQVTYLAYCSTTGLSAMDYRLTDPYLDPPGVGDDRYSEKSVRLARSYWCYQPPVAAPEPGPPPVVARGVVTFGCFNNYSKVTLPTLVAWTKLLARVPVSRLMICSPEGSHRQQVRELFRREGIDAHRIEFVGRVSLQAFLLRHREIDIALDPFPYAGGTTTCDALWMGIPVVSLAGKTAVGRGGCSILNNIGLPELVANSIDEYVSIAAALAGDVRRLTELRSALRRRMSVSTLMDARGFTRDIEEAYRAMWRNWCEKSK